EKGPPPPGGHVFQATRTIFKLVQDIIGTNLLTKFHDDWAINVASRPFKTNISRPPCGLVFQATGTIFELVIGKNLRTKFHEHRAIDVASRVFTRQMLMPHNS
ncbi:hypothetical protein DPMN_156695, partial [Dreissena polymorpha]